MDNPHAHAIIGIKVDKNRLYQEPRRVKAFDHNYDEETFFCPKTGRRLWRSAPVAIPEWHETYEKLGEYKVYLDYQREDDPIVSILKLDEDNEFSEFPANLEERKQELKDFLEPLGMWDESKFGLYCLLRWY